MGNTDSIPVVSQTKSLVQAVGGDKKGARQTQLNFIRGTPVLSQIVWVFASAAGNDKFAKETQEYFSKNMSAVADSIPGLGHAKGIWHYGIYQKEAGDNAMKAASRTTGVILGAVGGFFVGGPVGSVAGGVAAGAAMDGIITAADTAVQGEYAPSGHLNFAKKAHDGELDVGGYFDWVMTPIFDGAAGRSFVKMKGPSTVPKVVITSCAKNAHVGLRTAPIKKEERKMEGTRMEGRVRRRVRQAAPSSGKKEMKLETEVIFCREEDMAVVCVKCSYCSKMQRMIPLENVQVDADGGVPAAEVAKAVQASFARVAPKVCKCMEE